MRSSATEVHPQRLRINWNKALKKKGKTIKTRNDIIVQIYYFFICIITEHKSSVNFFLKCNYIVHPYTKFMLKETQLQQKINSGSVLY